MKVTAGTIARTVLLVLALVNQGLTITGHAPIPVDNALVEQFIALGFTGIMAIITYWKNNSWTKPALIADQYKNQLKNK